MNEMRRRQHNERIRDVLPRAELACQTLKATFYDFTQSHDGALMKVHAVVMLFGHALLSRQRSPGGVSRKRFVALRVFFGGVIHMVPNSKSRTCLLHKDTESGPVMVRWILSIR